jgi:hypothetical protein
MANNQNIQPEPVRIAALPLNDTGQLILPEFDDRGVPLRDASLNARPPYWTRPASYKILRQPVPTPDEPYQLPEGTAIDLRASGVGINDYFYVPDMNDNSQGILIMFTPEGRVARVSYSQYPLTQEDKTDPAGRPLPFDQPVVDNIYLLVGKRENSPPPRVDDDPTLNSAEWNAATTEEARQRLREPINWLSGNSRWIVIGSQSGRVVTVENAFVDIPGVTIFGGPSEPLRNQQILAAREFTREMGQLGGR